MAQSCSPTTSQAHNMACCDICGDIGVAETIITCSQCKINCEHMYCMRILIEEHLDDWCCEECESSSKQKPLTSCVTEELPHASSLNTSVEVRSSGELHSKSGKLLNESRTNWEKNVAIGKTQYLPVVDAIRLSSGKTKTLAFANVTRHSKPPRPEVGMKVSERTLIKPRNAPLGFASKEGRASGHLPPKPPRHGNMETSERNRQKFKSLTELQRSLSSLQPSQAPTNKHMQVEQPTEVPSPQTKARRLIKKPSSAPSPNASPVTISGGTGHTNIERRTPNSENVNNNLLPDLDECSCSPALDALWKGNFCIQDAKTNGELNHQIQAHPPSKVRRKIYEFSKRMPDVLHFQLVPLKELWINLFKEFVPDERDIGLYFFPSVKERCEDYISLLDSISAKNLALRKQIADVELLVFTSKLLPVNRQYWEGKNYLWGVFHRLKRDTTARLGNEGPISSVGPSDGHNNQEEVGMDIDMVGGIIVRREDVPANKREPLKEKHVSFKIPSATGKALPRSENPFNSVSRCVLETVPMPNVKMESDDLVPPGFEEVYRLRVEGSPSLAENVGKRELDVCVGARSFPAEVKSEYL